MTTIGSAAGLCRWCKKTLRHATDGLEHVHNGSSLCFTDLPSTTVAEQLRASGEVVYVPLEELEPLEALAAVHERRIVAGGVEHWLVYCTVCPWGYWFDPDDVSLGALWAEHKLEEEATGER